MTEPAVEGVVESSAPGGTSGTPRWPRLAHRLSIGSQARRSAGGAASRAGRTVASILRAWLVALVSWITCSLPERFVLRLADLGGDLWYRATPERAALARRQLRRVALAIADRETAPALAQRAATDDAALERLVRRAYRHAARYYVEVMRTPRLDGRYLRERILIETPDVVEAAFADASPVIFIAAHFGAIELPALYLADRTGRPVTGPMETVADERLQRWFVRTRSRVGIRIVGLREARRELLATLRRGESVGLVADRDISGGGLEVPFFGHPAPIPVGPALLAIESGAPVYLTAVRRDGGPGRYRARLQRIEIAESGSRRERVRATVAAMAAGFEEAIAVAPEQWWGAFFPIWPDLAEDPTPGADSAGAADAVGAGAGEGAVQ